MKRTMLGRDTRQKRAQATDASNASDSASLTSSVDSSLGGPVYIGGGDTVDRRTGRDNKERGGERGHRSSASGPFSAEPRWSRFAFSMMIPRPKQHTGLTAADIAGSSSRDAEDGFNGKGGSMNKASNKSDQATSSKSNLDRRGDNQPKAISSSSDKGRNIQRSSSAAPPGGVAAVAGAATWGSKLRLDIVRADAERSAGSPRSPRPGTEGGGGGLAGIAAASARFDSPARDLLQGYEDEQASVDWIISNHAFRGVVRGTLSGRRGV